MICISEGILRGDTIVPMHTRRLMLTCAAAWLAMSTSVEAGWSCSVDHAYPEVSELRVQGDTLIAILGTHFAERSAEGRLKHPRIALTPGHGWKRLPESDPPSHWNPFSRQCMEISSGAEEGWKALHPEATGGPPPPSEYSWFEQHIGACASDGITKWGGIAYYNAEGSWGAGGIVRQDIATGEVEILRPPDLVRLSVGPLAYFSGNLWFGATHYGECAGPPPGVGLRRLAEIYDEAVATHVPEVCGFAIRDFEEFAGSLWVATELGLSRLNADPGSEWVNFVPDLDHPGLFRQVTCEDLYGDLLRSPVMAQAASLGIGNAFDAFWNRQRELRPDFVRRYIRKLHGHEVEGYPTE